MTKQPSALSFDLRITSIYRNDSHFVAFSGVPIRDGRKSFIKEIYIVNTKPQYIAISPVIGQCWRVQGKYERVKVNHGRYYVDEVRINPSSCECILPETSEAIVRFLAETACFKGIGESKARTLLETFKKSLFHVIKSDDIEALVTRGGLTQSAAERLIEGFQKYSNLEHAQWLSDKRIPLDVIQRIIKYHGRETIEQITNNPYRLLQFGLPFKTKRKEKLVITMGADEIATLHFDITHDDPRRLSGALDDVIIRITEDGHTCACESEVIKRLRRLLGNDKSIIQRALEVGKETASIKVTRGNIYHPIGALIMENVIAKRLLNLQTKSFWSAKHAQVFQRVTTSQPFPLLSKQIDAVKGAMVHSVYAITGGAGTGKTTVLKTIMTAYKQLGMLVRGIALSGRAAMRMSEATGFQCCTIAKFLNEAKVKKGVIGVVIIDEASMVDLKDMYRIVMHIPTSLRLLFVGDADQLPPIGSGLIFHDIIKSGVIGRTVLDTVKRQSEDSGIPQYSIDVRDGKIPASLSNGSVSFHECSKHEVDNIAIKLLETYGKKETQIITPTNSNRKVLNYRCQDKMNPSGKRMNFRDGVLFQHVGIKENDPVIFSQNNYDAKVWNGTMGYLKEASSELPDVIGIVEDDSGQEVPINLMLVDTLELAYAITLHKSQGSQFKRIIIAMTHSRQLDRSWLYTAITRATEHVHIVGTRYMLESAIMRVGAVQKRETFLKSVLIQGGKVN